MSVSTTSPPVDNRYWVEVNEAATNNAHATALDLVGYGKRVLELGPAAGHVTRVLVERGCEVTGIEIDPRAAAGLEGIAECVVGDLGDPAIVLRAARGRTYDVVLAGDVLEHLPDPLPALRACRRVLGAGGYVVVSVPNIAHADIALSLAQGEFRYNDWGLLDRTHVRFFTLASLTELLERTGFVAIEVRRIVRPVFKTEIGLDAARFSRELVQGVLAHPEAETYQFVVRAVPHDGDYEVSRLAARAVEADGEAHRERRKRLAAEAEALLAKRKARRWRKEATAAGRKLARRQRPLDQATVSARRSLRPLLVRLRAASRRLRGRW